MKKNNTNTSRNPREVREIRKDRLSHVQGAGDLPAPSPDAQRKE